MALIPRFSICQSSDCSELSFSEDTGVFDVTNNPGGYGTPNDDTTDILTAILTITLASGNSYNIDLFATGLFPTTDDSIEYIIPNTSIGLALTDQIPDQIISFTYTLTTASATYTQNKQQSFYCQVKCCVNSMFLNLDVSCDCMQDQIDLALKAYALYRGLVANSNCGSSSSFNNILAQLNKLCSQTNCSNCK